MKKLTFEEFEKIYRETFSKMMSYTPQQIGSVIYCEQLSDLADAYPEWTEMVEAEQNA